jgi:putative ABC transport system permease protein
VFSGSAVPSGDRLVAGRSADPRRPGEFVATRSHAEANGLSVGDSLDLLTLTPEQVAEVGFAAPQADGPTLDATLVGIIDGPSDLSDPTPIAIFSPALLDDARIAFAATLMAIGLRDGSSVTQLREDLDTISQGALLRLEAATIVSPETRNAVGTQALGLWILAGIGAVGAIAALGQILLRHVRLQADERLSLSSLGYSTPQVLGEAAARAGVLAAAALALGAGVAVAASGLFPIGFVRRIEPDPGLRIDVPVMAIGASLITLALVGWVVASTRAGSPAVVQHPHQAVVDSVAVRCPSPTMATGVRFAFASNDPATLLSRIGGMALLVAAVVGTLTFAVSVRRLTVEPTRYGANFDFLADNGSSAVPERLLTALRSDPAVEAATVYTSAATRVGGSGETLALAGMRRLRGVLEPEVLAGRLPLGPQEIAIGRVSARRLDLAIGDQIELATEGNRATYEITGLIVPQGISGNDLVGQGAVVTSDGYARLDPEHQPAAAAIRLRPDTDADTVERIATASGVTIGEGGPTPPPAIRSIARITFVPFVLAALLAVLLTLSVVAAVAVAVRRRERHVGVLRSLGVDRPWLTRAVGWQGVLSTLVPAVVGAPLGFVLGRLVFRMYADRLGTLNGAAVPVGFVLGGLVMLLVSGIATGAIAGRRARRIAPAALLRAE